MHLNCHTYYSFRYGTLSPKQLVQEARARGQKTLVLTDINNTSCASEFIRECRAHDIKPILGLEFRQDGRYLYTGVAHNAEGFRELNGLLTQCSLAGEALPEEAPQMEHSAIIYRHLPKPFEALRPNEYVGVRPGECNRLFRSELRYRPDKLVVFSPVSFADLIGYRVHKLLRCVDQNIIIGKLRAADCAQKTEQPHSPDYFRKALEQYPGILRNTEELLEKCSIELPCTTKNNRQTFTGNESDDYRLLYKLSYEGFHRRYGMQHRKAFERLEKELDVIRKLGYGTYFLITWDIIRYAQSAGFHHVGRGSGANSIVAYCLYITDVDPLELDLYFERFINPHRSSPPDFDIDFSWDERDQVTDYIFKRYGTEHTALLATYNTFKGKSIIRELGKVLGLPKADIDCIVHEPLANHKHHPFAKHIFHYGKMIEKFPNYLSIHAGGVVISQRPINYHTALQMMPKGFPITHFDMYHAEDMGFHKYDILSQRGLGHIKDAVKLVSRNQGKAVDIHDVVKIKTDRRVSTQLKSGQCIGCFYIESPAMRGLLHKLRCDNYIHLVAASSIIRPGVAKSGMMREYIKRFHNPEEIRYLHPVFEEHLGETYGVMVYQEDVMKIVHHFAGLDLDESDVLRRIMTGKKKSSDTFRQLHDKFFRNCKLRGYPDALTHEVWRQVESFSGYSFCKAHSASFAVESFQSLYLKAYYPLEFMVGVINNFGGFYRTEVYVHEARMQGAQIEAPCVNNSTYLTTIYGETIYLGFVHVQNLERKVAEALITERLQNGLYTSLENFVRRVDISKEQLEILIRLGSFRFAGLNKYALMWEKNAVHNPQVKHCGSGRFFDDGAAEYKLPALEEGPYEQAFDEIELLGFPLCSPFDLLGVEAKADCVARELPDFVGKTVNMLGYYVTRKPVTTVNGKHMSFGTWVDAEGRFFDTTHFPPCLARYPFKGAGIYRIKGKIVEDFGFPGMEAEEMEKLPFVGDPRY